MHADGLPRRLAWQMVYKLPLGARRRLLYTYYHGRPPHLRSPSSFTEKINWRILHDRRPLIGATCDKLQIKERAARVGVAAAETLWSGTDIAELAGVSLPERWVLKPNHRSQLVHFGAGPVRDVASLRMKTEGWLEEREGVGLGEWAYTQARPLLLVERMLGGGDKPPPDYRFFVFAGDVRLIQIDSGKPDDHRRRFYTTEWQPLNVRQKYPLADPLPRPDELAELLTAAAALGKEFDFIRVDLYSVEGIIYLGELTPYPTGGMIPFTPRSFDREIGEHWTLPALEAIRT